MPIRKTSLVHCHLRCVAQISKVYKDPILEHSARRDSTAGKQHVGSIFISIQFLTRMCCTLALNTLMHRAIATTPYFNVIGEAK